MCVPVPNNDPAYTAVYTEMTVVDSSIDLIRSLGGVSGTCRVQCTVLCYPDTPVLLPNTLDCKCRITGATCTEKTNIVDDVNNVGMYSSLQLNGDGNPIISYLDYTTNWLKVAVCYSPTCEDGTITVNTVTANTRDVYGVHSSLQLNAAGLPIIAYYDGYNRALQVAICGTPSCSPGSVIYRILASRGIHSDIQLEASGKPVISYYNDGLGGAFCGNPVCSNTNQMIDGGDSIGYYSSLQFTSDNRPVISYVALGNELRVAVCADETCTEEPTINIVDSDIWSASGSYTSLQLDHNDYPIIAYYDRTNTALNVAFCNDPTCSTSPSITTIDDGIIPENVGPYSSLKLNSQGFPVIAYYSESSLKMAICRDLTCSTFDPDTVDNSANVGQWNSLQLDGADDAIISYYDATTDDVKVARNCI